MTQFFYWGSAMPTPAQTDLYPPTILASPGDVLYFCDPITGAVTKWLAFPSTNSACVLWKLDPCCAGNAAAIPCPHPTPPEITTYIATL